MPGLDRTGPYGEGPKTGRGMGKCNPGNKDEQFDDSRPRNNLRMRNGEGRRGAGRGPGRGRGFGRGRGRFGNGNRT
ncbi:MAG: DUF5320 domain-containing protein [Bacteroidales bacterium]|nr:DUF5320 domain-containing protein [Bacteroidales bacterium]